VTERLRGTMLSLRLVARQRGSARVIGRDSWLGRTSRTGVPPGVSPSAVCKRVRHVRAPVGELSRVLVHGAVDQLAAANGPRKRDPDWRLRVR
jgi:hypothetical protein